MSAAVVYPLHMRFQSNAKIHQRIEPFSRRFSVKRLINERQYLSVAHSVFFWKEHMEKHRPNVRLNHR
jgi:hypothetical protein